MDDMCEYDVLAQSGGEQPGCRSMIATSLMVAVILIAGQTGLLHAQCSPTPSEAWRSTASFGDDPFAVRDWGTSTLWMKFMILSCDPDTVIFQDCTVYPFHFDFASAHIEQFLGIERDQFATSTLYAENQQAVLGAVLMPLPDPNHEYAMIPEIAIQLVRRDPYDTGQAIALIEQVVSSISASFPLQVFYFPAFEQQQAAEADRHQFASHAITVESPGRWAGGNTCYSTGWALGTLRFLAPDAVGSAFRNGTLKPDDVLLTSAVPAELPPVAGVISLTPATANSHAAILAQTFAMPFVFPADQKLAERARALVGHRVMLTAYGSSPSCEVVLEDTEGLLSDDQVSEIQSLREPPPLQVETVTSWGAYAANTDDLGPADIRFFGGKAANFGILRQAIPANSPVAMAFSFDLFKQFLAQEIAGGGTLGQAIDGRLGPLDFPPDIAALSDELAAIRNLITDSGQTVFTATQRQAVLDALGDPAFAFDPERRLRFRSSTNVEDSQQLTGAGLYDSYSGCLSDDLDHDDEGPSHCDPDRQQERGVFRAIRKVFASFYNQNAVLERIRHGVNEDQVGMALLVHHSFPDSIELANGVATLTRDQRGRVSATLVSQPGAVSVANPPPGAVPEEVWIEAHGAVSLVRYSNQLLLGDTVFEMRSEYYQLMDLLEAVAARFEEVAGVESYTLDLEYKKVSPGGQLVIKQVRQLPDHDTTPSVTPFLVGLPTDYCVFQGDVGSLFANHRLKSVWTLKPRSFWMTADNLEAALLDTIEVEYLDGCTLRSLHRVPETLAGFSYSYTAGTARLGWLLPLPNQRTYDLEIAGLPTQVAPSESPLLTLADSVRLRVDYDQPVAPDAATTDEVLLVPCRELEPAPDGLRTQTFSGANGESIVTRYWWPYWPTEAGGSPLSTAPAGFFEETIITGLTAEPLTFSGRYAHSYRPGRHNFFESFLFDPFLDPQVPSHQLQELEDQGIRQIQTESGIGESEIVAVYGNSDSCGEQLPPRQPQGRSRAPAR